MSDPDARPIRKGKLGKRNEFDSVAPIAEVSANTRRGARGFVLAFGLSGLGPRADRPDHAGGVSEASVPDVTMSAEPGRMRVP